MIDADEAEATRAQRECIDQRIIQLDDELRTCNATMHQLQSRLRCLELDVEASALQQHIAAMTRADVADVELTAEAAAQQRAGLVRALDTATRRRDELRGQKHEQEQRVLRQALCMVQRTLHATQAHAAQHARSSAAAEATASQRVQLLCELQSAVECALAQQLPLQPVSHHSINFYCRLPCSARPHHGPRADAALPASVTDDDAASPFAALALRHCRPPHATRMLLCLGMMHATADRVVFAPGSCAVTLNEVDEVVYDGEVDDRGERSGVGTGTYPDGTRYTGAWVRGKRHGRGVSFRINGDRYDGDFVDDRADSQQSKLYLANGDVYTGAFCAGMRDGRGELQCVSGEHYSGMWRDDQRHGIGVCSYANGSCYEGEWRADKRHGDGCVRDAAGGSYRGSWAGDVKHGGGAVYFVDGVRYDGVWVHGQRRGQASAFATPASTRPSAADDGMDAQQRCPCTDVSTVPAV